MPKIIVRDIFDAMPIRHRRRFDPARARRILRLIGLSNVDLMRLLNRRIGGAIHPQDVSAWLAGRRALPDAAVVLLKALVREQQWRRGHPPCYMASSGEEGGRASGTG